MLRKLALSLAVAGAIASSQANALGLGDIRIKSSLNEPLDAEIQLLQVDGLNPLQIRPGMADEDEFALAGLRQSRALSDVRFQVKLNPNGTGVIRLTSRDPVREPFMNFLMEVNWPSGRLVREYTLLLDPPVFDSTPAKQNVRPARAAVRTEPSVRASRPVSSRPRVQTQARPPSNAVKDGQLRVRDNDTLWGLAVAHRVAPDVNSYQMMLALQKKNPEAFLNGSIHQLQAGSVLQLPSPEEAREISSQQAQVEVRRQTQLWKQGSSKPVEAPKKAAVDASSKKVKEPTAEKEAPAEEPDNQEAGQLKVVTPTEKTEPEKTAPTDAAGGGEQEANPLTAVNEDLENRLAVSQESIERLERDNADLDNKLSAIQEQLDSLQKLVELKDKQLATLQAELEKKNAALAAPPPEKSFLDKLLETPEYLMGLGAGLLALLAGLWLALRGKKPEEPANSDAAPAPAFDVDADDQLKELDAEELENLSALDDMDLSDSAQDMEDVSLDLSDLDLDLSSDEALDAELDSLNIDDVEEMVAEKPVELDSNEEDLLGLMDEDASDSAIENEEFDIAIDDLDMDVAEESQAEIADDAELDASLDNLLGEEQDEESLSGDALMDDFLPEDSFAELDALDENNRTGLGSVEPLDTSDDDDIEDSLEALGLGDLDNLDDLEAGVEEQVAEADDDALEFNLDDVDVDELSEESATESAEDLTELEAELDGLDFELADLDDALAEDAGQSDTDEGAGVGTAAAAAAVVAAGASMLGKEESDELPDLDLDMADLETAQSDDELPDLDLDLADLEASTEMDDVLPDLDLDLADLESEDSSEELPEVDLADVTEVTELSEADELIDLDLDLPVEEASEELPDMDLVDVQDDELELPVSDSTAELADDALDELEADLDLAGADLDDLAVTDEVSDSDTDSEVEDVLDSELDALLASTDNDIALEETSADEDPLDALGLLDSADEVETKLDLARAYIDMDDVDGAKEILSEVAKEGSEQQRTEAEELLRGIS